MKALALIAVLVFMGAASAQVFRDPSQPKPAQATKPAQQKPQEKRVFADPGTHDPKRERCENLQREIREIRRREREATTTGDKDQARLSYQDLLKQKEGAGCR